MYDIAIANEQNFVEIDEERLRHVVQSVLEAEQVREASISIAIIDDPSLRRLNKQHLDHDYDTDVLSFLLECEESGEAGDVMNDTAVPAPRGCGKRIEGEVIASAEMAVKRAGEFQWRPIDELTLYVIHGLLHLTGYDDLDEDERERMRSREREMLHHVGLSPRES